MAIQFQSLKLKDPDLFGVSLAGSVSRSDKTALQELAQPAMSRKKVQLVLDLIILMRTVKVVLFGRGK